MVIVATTAIVWSILIWLIRLFVRLKIHGPLGWDDYHSAIATIFGIINSSITISQVHFGLGRHVDQIPIPHRHRQFLLAWVANLFYILALCFTLLSVCCLIIRIVRYTSQSWLAQSIAAVTSIWAVTSFFLIAFMCHLPQPWIFRPHSRCLDIVRLLMRLI